MTEQTKRRRVQRGQGGQLREDILTAAERLLAEGAEPADVSLRALARSVGVAATSIYLHFSNVDEVVHAVRKRFFADFGQALDHAAEAAGAIPADRVRARAHAYVHYGLDHNGRYRTMFAATNMPGEHLYDTRLAGLDVYLVVRNDVAAALDGADAHLVATELWVALHGIVTLRTVRPDFPWPDLDRTVDDLVRRLLAPHTA